MLSRIGSFFRAEYRHEVKWRADRIDTASMLALSVRQPYAELILRGEKRIEYRSRPTRIIGERFYIYAARTWAGVNGHDLKNIQPGESPTGVIVGSAVIDRCERHNGHWEWHLRNVKRYRRPRKPTGRPQPVWFRPF